MHILPACSNKVRPSVQKGAKGHQYWKRDVYHARKSGMTTYCGLDASDYLRMDPIALETARADLHFCKKCAAALANWKPIGGGFPSPQPLT